MFLWNVEVDICVGLRIWLERGLDIKRREEDWEKVVCDVWIEVRELKIGFDRGGLKECFCSMWKWRFGGV